MSFKMYSFVVFYWCFKSGLSQQNGEPCDYNGAPGQCLLLRDCPSADADPKTRKICGLDGLESIICCSERSEGNSVATPAPIQSTTTEYVPVINEYTDVRPNAGKCAPLSNLFTAEKTGRKAWDKCIEYQEQLVYPCERGADLLGRLKRGSYCSHKADELIVGGSAAKRNEFPHMAVLSFEQSTDSDPICGGAVISEKFILTAGHCTCTKERHKVSIAKVGLLHRSESVPESRVHRIKRIIKHPDYRPPSKYHDIALLETETTINFDQSVIPACLHTGEEVDDSRASATGWGDTANLGSNSDVLLKVTLMKFDAAECKRRYQHSDTYLQHGYDANTQLCYGDHDEAKDTCQGDSGGPLQINNTWVHCMYTVIGVTSYGKDCGKIGYPAVYTRVAAYTEWIESVVWP